MRFLLVTIISVFIFTSCNISGVEKQKTSEDEFIEEIEQELSSSKDSVDVVEQKEEEKAQDTLRLDNGIVITYYLHGKGETLKKGEMIQLDYRAKLEDGTIFDGNHVVRKPWIPFLVGWNMQTPGWDLALEHLKVGDDVDIFIPSHLARGEKGIRGVVPPNANNIISMRVIERFKPMKEGDGIQIWKYDEVKEPGDSIGFEDEVYINYWVSSESNPRYDSNYQRGEVFKLVMGDGNIVPGLYKALYYGREGDRLMIKIPPEEAYGSKGLQELVKPNEEIFYDIQIAKVIKKG